jgi:hypothetical protein
MINVKIRIDPPAPVSSSIAVMISSTGGDPEIAYTTTPVITDGEIILPVEAEDSVVSFKVISISEGISENDVEIEFELFGLGEGITTDGISGVFSSIPIESKIIPGRTIFFEEPFGNCTSDGSQEFPENWTEVEVSQNALNTTHWSCSAYHGPCLVISAFDDAGTEGDGAEIWLVSPQIDLGGANQPVLNFLVDRRFDTESFQEYDLKISTNYDGSNFEEATWTRFSPAVVAMEANDPEEDNLDPTGNSVTITLYTGR